MTNLALILGIVSTGLCQGSFNISREATLWSTQSNSCVPATPEIEADNDTYQVNESLGVVLPLDERVWVGYYQVDKVFEYIGCVPYSTLFNYPGNQSFIKINGDPGHCYPGCGDDVIIGVTRTRCYCLGSNWDFTDSNVKCSDICANPRVLCGRDLDTHFNISVYKMNDNVIAATIPGADMDSNCLAMSSIVNGTYTSIWRNCDALLAAACSDGYNIIHKKYLATWFHVAVLCFAWSAYPITYRNTLLGEINLLSNWNVTLWTGLFKTKVILKYNKARRKEDKIKFGYLKKKRFGDRVELIFSDTDSREIVLCKESITESDITTVTMKGSTFSKPRTTSVQHFSSATNVNINHPLNDESPVISILTGVCVFLLVLLVSLSLAYLCRRRMSRTASDQVHYLTPNYMTAVANLNIAAEPENDNTDVQYDDGDLISQHDYATAEEIANENDQVLQRDENRTSDMYYSIENEERDEEGVVAQTSTGVYESLQGGVLQKSNYDTLDK